MKNLQELLKAPDRLSKIVSNATGMCVYPESASVSKGRLFAMARKGAEKQLIILFDEQRQAADFTGKQSNISLAEAVCNIKLCPLTHQNAEAVRGHLPFTRPIVLGVKKSIGTGDRLGIATPGHVLAIKKGTMRPFFCQQSIREMTRTNRTARQVMDCASFGVFQAGWQNGFGADADHLKTQADIDTCFNVGFTFYTIDPGDYVDHTADSDSTNRLEEKFAHLPWDVLQSSPADCATAYADKNFSIADFALMITAEQLLRAAVKYGRAIAHVVTMFNHLKGRFAGGEFELEVSVDETATPTSIAEHYYIASELKRLGVEWVSLAPRFIGDFEKGVDYIGDLDKFASEFAKHIAIATHFGPYKISLHSGSDKFSIYPIVAELAGKLVHLKTAGTSYLEALRAIATAEPALFRRILSFAKKRYPADSATYHVSANIENVPNPDDLKDHQLPCILDDFDTRQACHVTFGSVLTAKKEPDGDFLFYDRFMKVLRENEQLYYKMLEEHIGKHIMPFSKKD